MTWQFVAVDEDNVALGDLNAKDRSATWRLSEPCEAGFTISGDSTQAGFVAELINDVLIYRDHSLVFRGRMCPTNDDDIAADDYDVQAIAIDYRGMLSTDWLIASHTAVAAGYTAVDQAAIGWDLINDHQSAIGGDLGITQGTGNPTGVVRTRSVGYYKEGKILGDAVDELSNVINGFDYEIDALRKFNVYYPFRGSLRDFAVTFVKPGGGNVSSLKRSVDPSTYANVVRVSGDTGTTAAIRFAGDIATRPEGRWGKEYANTDLKSNTAITETADRTLADVSNLRPSYTATLSADSGWDPTKLWVGDTCPIRIKRGRLDVTTVGRVVELSVDVDENDAETVSLTFDHPPIKNRLIRDIRSLVGRVDDLARR